MDPVILLGVILALGFTAVNGYNDVAHSVATSIATRAVSPGKAVVMAALANFAGPFIFAPAVAVTIGMSLIAPSCTSPRILISGLAAALILVLIANRKGLPISSSHALVGGLLGSALASCGFAGIILPITESFEVLLIVVLLSAVAGTLIGRFVAASLNERSDIWKVMGISSIFSVLVVFLTLTGFLPRTGLLLVITFILVSPTLGLLAAFGLDVLISHIFRYSRQDRVQRVFPSLQVGAGLVQALSHGANDGQHAVGVITALLLSAGIIADFSIPFWVLFASAAAIAFGTGLGGWRVIDRVARHITRIRPYQGVSASVSGAAVLTATTWVGIPTSSSHVISGAIVGVGVTRGEKAVRWDVVREILAAWLLTIPLSLVLGLGISVGWHVMAP